ncbi:MAG: anthrone oxygenase family protein [Nocardioidaceae bacterium]
MSADLSGEVSLVTATIAMGLMAGLFYGFACSVMPGLRRADDRTFVVAMQRINIAILNGWFAVAFGGAVVLTALAGLFHIREEGRPALWWIMAAFILYIVTLAITMRVSVPLNDQLEEAGLPDDVSDLHAIRTRFEAPWVRWNFVRGLVNTAAFICLIVALVVG